MAEMVLERKVNPPNPFGVGDKAVAPVKEKPGEPVKEEDMPDKKLQ
jgi:hypothetical protein